MSPARFPEHNTEFGKPRGWADEQCSSIQAFVSNDEIITAWEPSERELVMLNLGCPVFVRICGKLLPPMLLTVESPFAKSQNANPFDLSQHPDDNES